MHLASHQYDAISKLSWLIIDHFHSLRDTGSELGKLLVGGVFSHIVVSILRVRKLNDETMCRTALCKSQDGHL